MGMGGGWEERGQGEAHEGRRRDRNKWAKSSSGLVRTVAGLDGGEIFNQLQKHDRCGSNFFPFSSLRRKISSFSGRLKVKH
jgi:hypothetical protein